MELLKKIFRAQLHSEEMLLQINQAIDGIHTFDMFRLNLIAGERYKLYLEAEQKKKSWEEDLAKILIHFGRSFVKSQQFDQAKKFFEKVVEVQPEEPYNWIFWDKHTNHFFVGLMHFLLKDFDQAEKSWNYVLYLNPNHPETKQHLQLLKEARKKFG
ncbi:MAG: hypothetical protein GPJ52_03870 [Candidatus Heimdallarchaeota archaeon]|nr:hypothetical protein [Candidatus Heimdallarchaeota archaeon]